MSSTDFAVRYEGPALSDGQMPVQDLAPALLALGNLFVAASMVAYPDRKPAALSIKATTEGSFAVDLILDAQSMWDQVQDIFSGETASALANLQSFVTGGTGLFFAVRALHRRKIAKREETPGAGMVKLTLDDGTMLELPAAVLDMVGNVEIRKSARAVVEPLQREGIEAVTFETEKSTTIRITSADVEAFTIPELDDVLLDVVQEMVVSLASVAFTDDAKWRLTDGENTFAAIMEDEAFIRSVDAGEKFSKGDMLRCDLRLIQKRRRSGLYTERRITRVIEHIPREIQLELDAP